MTFLDIFPSLPRSLPASKPHVASAGCAKRKQSARPPMGEGVSNKACPKPFPTLPYQPSHIPPRQAASPSFFRLFLVSNFSFQNPSQSLSKGPPWDPKITKNLSFSFQNRPKDHPFVRFSVDLCFYHFLDDLLVIFSGKNDTKNDESFHSCAFFFGTADPYDSMVFTIRKLLFQFWPF